MGSLQASIRLSLLNGGKRKGKEASWIRETEWYLLVHGQSSEA